MTDTTPRGKVLGELRVPSVITFDCYGTLVDWESGILAAMQPVLARHGVEFTAEGVLQAFARSEAAVEAGPYVPYREVLRRTFTGMAADLGFAPREEEVGTLVRSLPAWPVYGDTPASLRALQRHMKVGIISNVDDDLFASTVGGLGITPDFVVTAMQVAAYKPSRELFDVAEQRCAAYLGGDRGRWMHAAQSRFHDILTARRLGLQTAWVQRPKGRVGAVLEVEDLDEVEPFGSEGVWEVPRPDVHVPDLATLVQVLSDVAGWT
jgi:2-haloalkanoic acid dehalogenase type II